MVKQTSVGSQLCCEGCGKPQPSWKQVCSLHGRDLPACPDCLALPCGCPEQNLGRHCPACHGEPVGKDPAAVALGRRGGLKGGVARAKSLSAARRAAISRKAARARWDRVADAKR